MKITPYYNGGPCGREDSRIDSSRDDHRGQQRSDQILEQGQDFFSRAFALDTAVVLPMLCPPSHGHDPVSRKKRLRADIVCVIMRFP